MRNNNEPKLRYWQYPHLWPALAVIVVIAILDAVGWLGGAA